MPSPNCHPLAHHSVTVATAGGHYPILIGTGLIDDDASWAPLPRATHAVIVSNSVVAAHYGPRLQQALARKHRQVSQVLLPDGEAHKQWATLEPLFQHLLEQTCDRKTQLYALGGGVVGDMAGFAAAIYMRGIPFVQVPTTLLAQVDSSVGGKTAINHPLGKNMLGAFYQPLQVVCDLDTLVTLPQRELSAGLAEVIKYGPIADLDFLDWIEANLPALMAREPAALAQAVKRSCEIKAQVVGVDERESGLRAILNFGHTFGHAMEAGMGYGRWLHGEAVGCGMVLASLLSAELGLVDGAFVHRLTKMVKAAGLPTRAPDWPLSQWLSLMRTDKKAEAGAIRFVVINRPGQASVQPVDETVLAEVFRRHAAQAQ